MDNKIPPQVVVSPPEDDPKSLPALDKAKVSRVRPYLPLLVITLSLPIIFLSSRNQQNFFGRASAPCTNTYPCPTGTPRPCVNTYNCLMPRPVNNSTPTILTTNLPPARVKLPYQSVVMGRDLELNEAMMMTIDGLPDGILQKNCQIIASPQSKVTNILCFIIGRPTKPGIYNVLVTLKDRPGTPESITVSKQLKLQVTVTGPVPGTRPN